MGRGDVSPVMAEGRTRNTAVLSGFVVYAWACGIGLRVLGKLGGMTRYTGSSRSPDAGDIIPYIKRGCGLLRARRAWASTDRVRKPQSHVLTDQ